jgi:hypothetical protein
LEELNEVEFAMEFWQEDAKMASHLNDFLNQRFLLLKVWLEFEDSFVAAVSFIGITFAGTFPSESSLIESTFSEDCFDSFQLIRVFSVICFKNHGLNNPLPILKIPAIVHENLLLARPHIHP